MEKKNPKEQKDWAIRARWLAQRLYLLQHGALPKKFDPLSSGPYDLRRLCWNAAEIADMRQLITTCQKLESALYSGDVDDPPVLEWFSRLLGETIGWGIPERGSK